MKKLFEIDINEEFKRVKFSQYFLMFLVFSIFVYTRTIEKELFSLSAFVELVLYGLMFKFYFISQAKKNYAYWGISLTIGAIIISNLLKFTFFDYNILVIYLCFMAFMLLSICVYTMSSPIFFPRVQWWEYDFRYRGDLKSIVQVENQNFEARLTDLRRDQASIEVFEYLPLEEQVNILVKFDNQQHELKGIIKTNKEGVIGRPIRYGIKLSTKTVDEKENLKKIKKIWSENKNAKIRNKFKGNK